MKRKHFTIFIAFVLCLTCLHLKISFAEEKTPASNNLLWDMNADGKITLEDAQAVLLIALGITEIKDIASEQKQFTLEDAYYVLTLALGIPSSDAPTSEEPDSTTLPIESIEPDTTKQPEESSSPIPTIKPTAKPRPTKHPTPTLKPWPTSDPSVTPIPPEITITEEELSQIAFVEVYKAVLEGYNLEWYDHVYMRLNKLFKCANENERNELIEYLRNRLGKEALVDFNELNELFAQDIVYYWSYPIWRFRNYSHDTIFYINISQIHENEIIVDISFTQGGLDAQGYDVTLEKQDGHWIVVKTEGTWVS